MPSIYDSPEIIKLKWELFKESINGSLKLIRPDGKFDEENFKKIQTKVRDKLGLKSTDTTNSGSMSERQRAEQAISNGKDPKGVAARYKELTGEDY